MASETVATAAAGAYAVTPSVLAARPAGSHAGLTAEEAARRLALDGPNRLPEAPPVSRVRLLAAQFRNGMVALLSGAAAVALAFGQGTEAALIVAIVVANAALGYVQESRAESATRALRDLLPGRARVLRSGEACSIPADHVVVEDVLILGAGDRVPADATLLESTWLELDESVLTGESMPVSHPDGEPGMVRAGTTVARGSARAAVTATGARTEMGRLASSVPEERPRTPLQQRLDRLATTLLRVSVACGVVLGALSWAYGDTVDEAVLIAVSLAVAVVPEGLPAVVTVTLAVGMHRMATRGAVVRRLHAVETLGSTTVICSDKTGTLTENHMAVVGCVGGDTERVLGAAWLASEPEPREDASPEERAIALAARRIGLAHSALLNGARVAQVTPFDATTRRMSVTVEAPGGERITYVKGAPESLLKAIMDPAEREELAAAVRSAAEVGNRVLLVAVGEEELTAPGLVLLSDPPRASAAESIRLAREAGVRTLMITGDHPKTALAIAREIGLTAGGDERALTGAELDGLDDAELVTRLARTDVIARVAPQHKLRVVQALENAGEVVAMTGDGVNDVPALAAAHIGVAMGARGTDAAIDAGDMVLTDDDYSTIVRAIALGRAIHDNVARFVHFLLATNAGIMFVFALAIPLGLGAPLTVPQVLIVNLLTDGLPAVALGFDPPADDVMRRKPRALREGLLDPIRARLGLAGLTTGVACLAALLIGQADDRAAGQTMVFATLVAAKLLYVFSVRGDGPVWRAGPNPLLIGAVLVSAAIGLAILMIDALSTTFGTVVLSSTQVIAVAALATLPLAAGELYKLRCRVRVGGAA